MRAGTARVEKRRAQDGVRQAAPADYLLGLVFPAQVTAAWTRPKGREQDEVALAGRVHAARGFDELYDWAVVGGLIRVAGGETAAHRADEADYRLRVGDVLVEARAVGEIHDQR